MSAFPPGTTERMVTLSTGVRMRVYERGAGDVVLFLHGFPELALSYRDQFVLADRGYRCVAPDLRGYGGTDAPRDVASYAMPELVADVVSLIGGQSVHLVGHDWGGAVAWELARAHPELVRTLTILNCPPPDMMVREMMKNPRQLRRSWYMAFFQVPGLPERLLLRDPVRFMVRAFRSAAAPSKKTLFTAENVRPYAEAHVRTHLAGINYYRAAARAIGKGPRAVPLTMPVQLVWGVHDAALGPWFMETQRYASVATDFRIVPVADAGHWVQQESPEAVNAAILEHVTR